MFRDNDLKYIKQKHTTAKKQMEKITSTEDIRTIDRIIL